MRIFDDTAVYTFDDDGDELTVEEHGLGVCPVVRFTEAIDADGVSPGKVEPLLSFQRQLNQTTFSLLMTQQYSAFRQRWVTGMAIELDDAGNPKEPWNAAVNAVWHAESVNTHFGDFAESPLQPYLDSRDKTVLAIAATAQTAPHHLLVGNGISNIASDTLSALEASFRLDVEDHKEIFGEALEQLLRLAGLAMGDTVSWEDTSARVKWADTTFVPIGALMDALGKMVSMLGVPEEAAWERIPGVTDEDLAAWKKLASQDSVMQKLQSMMTAPPARPPAPPGQPALPPPMMNGSQPSPGSRPPAADTAPQG